MLTARQKAINALESAATVILAPGWHAKGAAVKNRVGSPVAVWDPEGCQFCAVGAIHAAGFATSSGKARVTLYTGIALNALCSVLGVGHDKPVQNVAAFNDAAGTTPTMVAQAMLQAADNLRNHTNERTG